MAYEYKDIVRCALPDKLKEKFILDLTDNFYLLLLKPLDEPMDAILKYTSRNDKRFRAIDAYNGLNPKLEHENRVLKIWLKYADQLDKLEKILLGWEKYD